MLSILALVGFLLMLVVKSVPSYLAQFKVSSALSGLKTDDRLKETTAEAIRSLLEKKFQVDDVEGISKENIIITKTKTGYNVQIKYESRVSMIGNIDAVIMFDESVELITR
ncbi:DUF4845 domain-containing protein [Pseudomonadota bacterium]